MSDLPSEFVPDGNPVVGGHECPGCDEPLPEPSVPYSQTEYKGDTWHMECAYRDSDDLERVDTPRRCRNCWRWGEWTPIDAPRDVRMCDCCGWAHRGPTPDEFDGPAPSTGGGET